MSIILINKIDETKIKTREWKKEGKVIGLVPTMGALHAGHASLIKKAKEMCDKVVVSVFVNPIQFCPGEDYDKYPRTLEKDLKTAEKSGADVVFAPTPLEMYGENKILSNTDLTYVCPPYNLTDCLCGKSRPGHFDGVATVVTKLLNIVAPDYAFFGRKDAQQLFILQNLVKDLNMDVKIIPCPIVREPDGLALSSRNTYLSPDERTSALTISQALKTVEKTYLQGIKDVSVLTDTIISVLDKNLDLEYVEFRNYETFEKVTEINSETLVAIAARAGNTRLIDNTVVNGGKQ